MDTRRWGAVGPSQRLPTKNWENLASVSSSLRPLLVKFLQPRTLIFFLIWDLCPESPIFFTFMDLFPGKLSLSICSVMSLAMACVCICILKEISPGYSWKDWYWSWNSNTLATWYEELTYWKRPWCWERLKVGGEGDDRGWDGWMASLTQWTWVWVNSGSWWWTGRPDMLQSMGSQRVGHDWAIELNWS